jgi:hypothetical protein
VRTLLLSACALGVCCALGLQGIGPTRRPDVTFFVASDSHFGAVGMEPLNREVVRQLNALPGTAYPATIGNTVAEPRGVLFLGDMTDSGLDDQWHEFQRIFGLTGLDGLLRFPVFEALGNHDLTGASHIAEYITARHGSTHYSWDWDDVHLVCLGMHPDAENLAWLEQDLARLRRSQPLVVFFHYSLDGPYSDFWEDAEKDAFAREIASTNVIAIFHGHYHRAGHYVWRGHDVFRPGAPRHSSHVFLVARVTPTQIQVAYRDFDAQAWTDTVVRAIHR